MVRVHTLNNSPYLIVKAITDSRCRSLANAEIGLLPIMIISYSGGVLEYKPLANNTLFSTNQKYSILFLDVSTISKLLPDRKRGQNKFNDIHVLVGCLFIFKKVFAFNLLTMV